MADKGGSCGCGVGLPENQPTANAQATCGGSLKPQDFLAYYEMARHRGTDSLLLQALELMEQDARLEVPGYAVDLGCGTGKDTVELLRRNWRVLAIDYCQEGIAELLERPETKIHKRRLRTRVSAFEQTTWARATLVVALASLPYCPEKEFPAVWRSVLRSLKKNGYLVCHLFGDKEPYPGAENARHFSRTEVDQLLSGLDVVVLDDVRKVDLEMHYYRIIARRP